MEPDINAYIAVMEEIKRRTEVVFALHTRTINIMYPATHVESMVLQIRMITELIALASLAANRSIFEQNKKKFEKHWRLTEILKDVESLNPNFYPLPLIEEPLKNPRIKNELVDMEAGFMTRDELIEVHGRCANLLHARNPFGKDVDYSYYERMVPEWIKRIMKLLNCHQIKLLDDNHFYLVHMKEEGDDYVHMYTFEEVGDVDDFQPDPCSS